MTDLSPRARREAAGTLLVSRMVYAFNWYNVGAVFSLLEIGLHAGTEQIGIVLGAFLIGVGLFQVPAGLAAIRYGARRVSIFALLMMGIAGVASAFAPSWQTLALIRFVAGVGAAFFFSPALSLVASYYPSGQRGPVIGLYNGGFSIGGTVGIFAGAALGYAYGWPIALLVGGIGLLVIGLVAFAVLPTRPKEGQPRLAAIWSEGRQVLRSRSIWALSLALTGFWAAIYIVAQYFVAYGTHVHPVWGLGVIAALPSVVVLLSFPGGPVGGWLGERARDPRRLIALFAVGAGLSVLAIPFSPLWALWGVCALLGFTDGVVFAVLYLIPTYLPETHGEGLALGVAVVNSIQVFLGSGLAIAFGFIAADWGYFDAWVITAVLSLVMLPLLVLVRGRPMAIGEEPSRDVAAGSLRAAPRG
ncbi:MAG: MFS transporter [Thermoplasmata archaeon]